MNPDQNISPKLAELLELLCEQRISDAQFVELETLLRSDEGAIRHYVCYLGIHASLIGSHSDVVAFGEAIQDEARRSGGKADEDAPDVGEGIRLGPIAATSDSLLPTKDSSEKELLISTENILAILEEDAKVAQHEATEQARIESLAAEKFSVFQRERDHRNRPKPVVVPRNVFYAKVISFAAAAILCIFWMLPDPVPAPMAVASIDDAIDARWSDPSLSTVSGTQLFTLENLVLTRGVVQIGFEGGAKMVVEAPATLELLSPDSARLVWGRLVGSVPRSEVQLTIKTPQASIVDLGTEFGVEVNRQQVTHLHVFEGRVSAATFDSEGKTVQQQTVLVDEAVYLQPKTGAIEPAPVAAGSRFVKQILHPVPLQNPTATFSQRDVPEMDVRFLLDPDPSNAWAIGAKDGMVGSDSTVVLETVDDAGFADGTMLTFVFEQLADVPYSQANLGRFRLSLTTDDRSEFADGLATEGDVTANWTVLTPLSFVSKSGATLTKLADHSLLASGKNPATDVYTVTARTRLMGITGFRIEVLTDPSLPSGGPGRHPNGNFHLTHFSVNAALASEPDRRLPEEGNNSTNR